MSTSVTEQVALTAMAVKVTDDSLTVDLSDGRTITVPIGWYPRLAHATPAERDNYVLIATGGGIHWPAVEEDISVDSIINGRPSMESAQSLRRWLTSRSATSQERTVQRPSLAESKKPSRRGAFELKRAANGRYMFNLRVANNEVVLTSESYSSKAAAESGIGAVRRNATSEKNIEMKKSSKGEAYFNLRSADNGKILARSEMYSSLAAMEKAIRAVLATAVAAKIDTVE